MTKLRRAVTNEIEQTKTNERRNDGGHVSAHVYCFYFGGVKS